MPSLYHKLCQSGVRQQTTPKQGDKITGQQKAFVCSLQSQGPPLAICLGKWLSLLNQQCGVGPASGLREGSLVQFDHGFKWWGDPCWYQQYLSPRLSSFLCQGLLVATN